MKEKIDHIIWDWNGTLFDDVDICVENINWLLTKYNYPPITKQKYKDIFTFPVVEYYKRAGFDLNSLDFVSLGKEWMDRYEQLKYRGKLNDGAKELITDFFKNGIEQSILSAYSEETLIDIVQKFGLKNFFKNIVGLDNIYAESKLELGKKLMSKLNTEPDTVVLIGDTVHDYEVSSELGCKCILLACGHQSEQVLKKCNVPVLKSIRELKSFLEEISFVNLY